MESQILRHFNRFNPQETVVGKLLEPGDKIEDDDVYASTCGKWKKFSCSGQIFQSNSSVQIVRRYKVEMHQHPTNNFNQRWGVRLRTGDAVQTGDFFASRDGTWHEFLSTGHVILEDDTTYWVRMF